MIEKILVILKILLAILPFVLLCLGSKKVNLSKSDRSKQFFMPVITLVYTIVIMSLMNRINTWLLKLIDKIPDWIADLGGLSWMPKKIGGAIIDFGNTIENFLAKLNLNFWIFFISNTVMILVYLFIKKICMGIISKSVKTDGSLHNKIASIFYEYFPEKNTWCIKESYSQVRGMFMVFYYSAVVLSALLMIITSNYYYNGLIKAVFYPVFGILVVGELYFYLDGATRREYTSDILGEDEDAYKTVNYSLLRKFLRSIFGDRLLAENTSINNALSYDITTDEIIRDLEKNEDSKIVSFATYFDALNRTGFTIDHNYLYSSLDMLCGKSVLFNNPFYNDLIPYAFYPMNRTLLSHQKVLIVLGRHSIENDIKEWVEKGIEAVTNIPFMWNVGVLDKEEQKLDIGIVTRSDVLDIELHNANSEFLKNVGFVVIIEPSKLLSTAQIGLNLLVKKCKNVEDKEIVYCLCDKNCDGLVDAMSHVLLTSLTEVSATNKHLGTSSYMCWETSGEYLHHRLTPNISRYLGIGTELSFAALKNQVSKTKWYGGEAFPVTDMRWIDRQYYYELTKYASLPSNQSVMDERFVTTPNFWSAPIEKNNYLTVEDEAFNMFEILRDFSTRTTEQGFINIISSEYLLKDYMADNASIFEADAKAIPLIVADHTRSNRNTILRLVLMMSIFPVKEEILNKELSLLGINVFDLKKQLWYELYCCYSEVALSAELPEDYKEAVEQVYYEPIKLGGAEWTNEIIELEEKFNLKKGKTENTFAIYDQDFLKLCVAELRSAGFISEDEKGERYYLGAELCGHIYQKYLPGQFFTFGGKYYEMQYLTADGQIMARRAADHINGRPAYRQIREYCINGIKPSEKIGAMQDIAGLKVIKEFADISVKTPGYYNMERYNDFTTAKKVSFEGDKNGIPQRIYRNKEILRIELPDFDGKLNDNIRYTITLLFNEVFKTIFAENQAYIVAVTDDSFLAENSGAKPLTYSISGNGYEVQKNSIYIIEDSQLDLGLTVTVERNLQRIFSIIHDYLDWHMESMENSLAPAPEPQSNVEITPPEEQEPKKKGFFGRIFDKIKGWFKKKPAKGEEPTTEEPTGEENPAGETPETPQTAETEPQAETTPESKTESESEATSESETEKTETEGEEEKPKKRGFFGRIVDKIKGWFKKKPKKTEEAVEETPQEPEADTPVAPTDETAAEAVENDEESGEEPAETSEEEAEAETESESEEGVAKETVETTEAPLDDEISYSAENDQADKIGFSTERKPYHERYYMLYGRESEWEFIDLSGTLGYLSEFGLKRNSLKQAREGKKIADYIEATYTPGKPDARYCDFCGTEIFGVEYETLADGRDRCLNCGRTAVKTGEEFRKIFEDVKRNMESFFGIRINTGIKVEMVNSKTLHKRLGKAYIPTPDTDARILGVAIKGKNGYSLIVENGAPRMATMLTMAHELTHIWQYINWKDKDIRRKYGRDMRLEIYEGMAKWVEIQYAYLINEPATAKREEINTSYRDDEYGHGFLRYRANYPFSLGTVITKDTPFMNKEEPLDQMYCGEITVKLPTDGINPGDLGGKKPTPGGYTPVSPKVVKGPSERNPDSFKRYAYSLLNGDEKSVYDTVLEAINSFSTQINGFAVSVTDSQIQKILDYVQRDHPELFWFQHGATFTFDTTTHIVNKLELTYCMTKAEAEERQGEIESSVEPFLSAVNDTMSDYEVTLHIYENIIKLVDYDTIGLERQKKTTVSPDTPDDLRSIYGVFVNKKAVCAGYAKAMQYLLNLCGIECTYVTSDTHAWNLLKLEGDYYHMDVTWGDGSDTKKEKSSVAAINYDCFCITTAELSRLEMHTPEKDLPLPECTATKCNYHRRHGLYFEKFDLDRMKYIVCERVKSDKTDVSFKFASSAVFGEAKKQLLDNDKFREAIQFAALKANTKLDLNYVYSLREDKLTMAFFMTKL